MRPSVGDKNLYLQNSLKFQRFFNALFSNTYYSYIGSRGRVVKAWDLKTDGVFPRRLESCRLQIHFHVLFNKIVTFSLYKCTTLG